MWVILVALLLWTLAAYLIYSAMTTKPPKGTEEESVGDGKFRNAPVSSEGNAKAEADIGLGALTQVGGGNFATD